MRTLIVITALGSALAFAQPQAAPAVTTVEATGESAVFPGPEREKLVAKAIEKAQKEALRSAVEKASGVYIQSDTQTRNNSLVLDRIVTNASGYVKSFDVVSKVVEKDVAKVTIKAQIASDTLEKDVKAARSIVSRLFGSKLLIVLQEQLVDEKGVVSRSEFLPVALTGRFKDSGFSIIDEKGTGSSDLGLVLSSGVGQGKLDAKEILKRSDADFIIYGSANVRYVPPDPRSPGIPEIDPVTGKQMTFFVTGDYDLSMFATRTGQQLSKQAGRLNVQYGNAKSAILVSYQRSASFAVEGSSKEIVSSFFASVFEYLRDQDVNGAKLTVRVSGIPAFDEVEDVEKALGVVEGVKDVKAGEFADGRADFGVQFLGNSSDFGKALKGANIKKRKLVVTAVRNNVVEVNLVK